MTFSERPAGQPEALRAWFYPGRNWGEEFVYGKAMAIELAKASNETAGAKLMQAILGLSIEKKDIATDHLQVEIPGPTITDTT